MFLKRRPHFIPSVIVTGFLFGALAPWPYGYYQLLRWITCAGAVFVAYNAYVFAQKWAVWPFGVLAVLFNPISPIHLKRDTWQVLDVVAAVVFIAGIFAVRATGDHDQDKAR